VSYHPHDVSRRASLARLLLGVGFLALTIAGISLFDPKGTGNVPPPFFPANP